MLPRKTGANRDLRAAFTMTPVSPGAGRTSMALIVFAATLPLFDNDSRQVSVPPGRVIGVHGAE